jgi:predicted permease
MLKDCLFAFRLLRRSPVFALTAALTLALGIGANAAIFTVVNAVLLTPLPYADPGRIVMIWSKWTSFDKTWVSPQEYLDYRSQIPSLESVGAWGDGAVNLTGGDGEPERVASAAVSADLFTTLGVQAALGRTFTAEEDVPNGERVVVLGHGLWRRRSGADPNMAGRTIQVNGQAFTVVGVMPAAFQLPLDFKSQEPTQLWTPLGIDPANASRGNHGLYAVARLKPGATVDSTNAELDTLIARLVDDGQYPPAMKFEPFALSALDEVVGDVRPALLLLLCAVGFLLLIACANVANLLLARADARRREMALRTALGAGRGRLVRQALTEALALSAVGCLLGLGAAALGLRLLVALDPEGLPRLAALTLDGRVLAFAAGAAVLASVVFGLAPAVQSAGADPIGGLRESGRQASVSPARQRFRDGLVAVEIALAVMLAIGAALMVRSLWELQRVDLGFNPDRVLTMRLSLPQATYPEASDTTAFFDRLLDRVRALPGVERAGLVRSLPLAHQIGDWGLVVEGYTPPPGVNAKGDWQIASPGYFDAMGERLVRGRVFDQRDVEEAQQVAVINETMARTYWPGEDPIGRRFRQGGPTRPWVTIVGIVADVRHNGVTEIIKEKFYRPHTQFHLSSGNPSRALTLVVRTGPRPETLVGPVRAEIRALDPNLPVSAVQSMNDVLATALSKPRVTSVLLTLFGVLALALAAVGVYGVLSYLVSQQTQDLGIRMALGAEPGRLRAMVLRRVTLGAAAAAASSRLVASLLYGVGPLDPGIFAAIPAALFATALAASYLPARRATKVDPAVALRAE